MCTHIIKKHTKILSSILYLTKRKEVQFTKAKLVHHPNNNMCGDSHSSETNNHGSTQIG